MNFESTKEQDIKIKEWMTEHEKTCNQGAGTIGGKYSYTFTPTGLGPILKIECNLCHLCIDVTDYESW